MLDYGKLSAYNLFDCWLLCQWYIMSGVKIIISFNTRNIHETISLSAHLSWIHILSRNICTGSSKEGSTRRKYLESWPPSTMCLNNLHIIAAKLSLAFINTHTHTYIYIRKSNQVLVYDLVFCWAREWKVFPHPHTVSVYYVSENLLVKMLLF